MTELQSSQAHFVRCIKPNPKLVPQEIHGENTINQLRMSGMLDAVKLIQAGYPSRIPYEDLYGRYRTMMPENVQALPLESGVAEDAAEISADDVSAAANE